MDSRAIPAADAVDQNAFRNVVGHFASGVTVITAADDDGRYGTTASAVSSLSMDPPMMLVCLNRSSSTHDRVAAAGRYAINILSVDQGELASHFGRKGEDKFTGVAHHLSERGLPLIEDALATIECDVVETAVGGTHTIFLGLVRDARAGIGEPLAYYRGRFGSLEQSREAAAYDDVRDWVLRRRTPLGERLEPAELAGSLSTDASFVYNALVRLVAEGLVTRSEGGYEPTPVTDALVDNLYDARAIIETGVIEGYLADAPDDRLAHIADLAAALAAREPHTSEELDEFLIANLDLHSAIVGLAGSRQLTAQFRALSISTVWRETYASDVWQHKTGHPLIPRIAEAIAGRDVAGARELVRTQVGFVTQAAKSMIAQHGGAL